MEENKTYVQPPVQEEEEGIDIIGLVKQMWDGRKTIIICTAVFIVLGLVAALTMKRTYTVSSVMVPQLGSSRTSSLSSLASLAGFDLGTWVARPSLCMNTRSAVDPTTYDTNVNPIVQHPRCGNWLDRLPILTAFTTVMPPNSPSCFKYNQEQGQVHMLAATSYHSGGVNAGMVDGSVRFITDTIDTNGLADIPTGKNITGRSPLGVWGALGSPNGGETTAN